MGMKARCQCSKIQFETPIDRPLKLYICHCTECRHQSSSAFGITGIFPWFQLPESVSDLVGSYTRFTLKGRHLECLFCKNCGARLVHRIRDAASTSGENHPATLSVKGGCLEGLDAEMMRSVTHIWCKEAIVPIPEGFEKWDAEPPEPVHQKR